GKIARTTLPKPALPVSVRVGDIEAEVKYAGAAPGMVAGVMQVNVRIPSEVAPGDAVPVVLLVGNVSSQAGVELAVRW
ncbi:MAG: hypothetical protein M1541_02860, partial [Acidobacteria bacterium]|nr:hypothetical protein [Acidobacteriota bacterium]